MSSTPGSARAAVASMAVTRPRATLARTIAAKSWPGRRTSVVYGARPAALAARSTRVALAPTWVSAASAAHGSGSNAGTSTMLSSLRPSTSTVVLMNRRLGSAIGGALRAHRRGGALHGAEDFRIGATAAEVAAQRRPDRVVTRIGIASNERRRGHQLTRCAEPALRGILGDERRLERVRRLDRAESLDRADAPSGAAMRERDAAIHGVTVEQDGAGATLSPIADALGAEQPEVVTKEVEQGRMARGIRFDAPAVDLDVHVRDLPGGARGVQPV